MCWTSLHTAIRRKMLLPTIFQGRARCGQPSAPPWAVRSVLGIGCGAGGIVYVLAIPAALAGCIMTGAAVATPGPASAGWSAGYRRRGGRLIARVARVTSRGLGLRREPWEREHRQSDVDGQARFRRAWLSAPDSGSGGNPFPCWSEYQQGHRHQPTAPSSSAHFSPIMSDGALVLPPVMLGMIEASATRSPSMPRTFSAGSTTAASSTPMRQVPTG